MLPQINSASRNTKDISHPFPTRLAHAKVCKSARRKHPKNEKNTNYSDTESQEGHDGVTKRDEYSQRTEFSIHTFPTLGLRNYESCPWLIIVYQQPFRRCLWQRLSGGRTRNADQEVIPIMVPVYDRMQMKQNVHYCIPKLVSSLVSAKVLQS